MAPQRFSTLIAEVNDPDTGWVADDGTIYCVAAEEPYPATSSSGVVRLDLDGTVTVVVPPGTFTKLEGLVGGYFDDSGRLLLAVCDQEGHSVHVIDPDTGDYITLVDVAGTSLWAHPHDAEAIVFPGSTRAVLVFTAEGTHDAARGGVFALRCTGADAMDADDWEAPHTITQMPGAWHATGRLADFSGSGRGDLLFTCRNNRNNQSVPGISWAEQPVDPWSGPWTVETIVDEAGGADNANDFLHADFGEFSGDGNGLDVVGFASKHDPGPTMYQFSDSWAATALPYSKVLSGSLRWLRNIRRIDDPNSTRDAVLWVGDLGIAGLLLWNASQGQYRVHRAWSTDGVQHASDGRIQQTADGWVYVFDSGANKVHRWRMEAA